MKYKMYVLVFLATALIITACNKDNPVEPPVVEPVTVMTWNVYVGTDVDKVIGAQSVEDIPIRAAEAFQLLQATNFPERALAIAEQISRFKPHLIGLQEIAIIRTQLPGDAAAGGTSPAEDVLLDYLDILVDALDAQGLDYNVAGKIQNTDAEVPAIISVDPLQFMDVRLTDFDVVLTRNDVNTSRIAEVSFAADFSVSSLGLNIKRGYVALDAEVAGNKYRFINTHLEPASNGEEIQLAQAQELVDALQGETLPIILVGDLNTQAPNGGTYTFLKSNGFVDIWPLNTETDNPTGFTSPHDADLRNSELKFHQRIDLIFVNDRPEIKAVTANVIGDEPEDRTPSGIWPSDHAGVIAELQLEL